MNNDYVYFIGGPADLSKQAYRKGSVPSTIEVVKQEHRPNALPTDQIRYTRHTYTVRRLGPGLFMAIHPEAMEP